MTSIEHVRCRIATNNLMLLMIILLNNYSSWLLLLEVHDVLERPSEASVHSIVKLRNQWCGAANELGSSANI